jgi:predicted nucleic-acid-binding protein
VAQALSGHVTLCSTATAFAEFVHLVERMELQCEWVTDPNQPELDPENPGQPFSPKYVKNVRYHYRDRLAAIRANVETYLHSARRNVELLPAINSNVDPFTATVQTWRSSTADISDAVLVAEAKRAGVPNIVSDDADFVSFEGIHLYSANPAVIAVASQSNKLIRSVGR